MVKLDYFFDRLKDVKVKDLFAFFPMVISLLLCPFFKKKYRNSWLICEEKEEARDNGYWFFRKMRENHPDQKCIYAIDKKSVDYKKVRDLGQVISYGSILHWIVYFCCEFNISSQKGGKPNAAICAFIELNDWHNAHNIFLQHGIIINDLRWLYADRSRFDMFITSTIPETEFIESRFGYNKGIIKLCGLPRFDNLHDAVVMKNRILIMPTWRYWFNLKSKEQIGLNNDFIHSKYMMSWKSFLESTKLQNLIKQHDLEVIFYLHRNLQYHLKDMKNIVKTSATFASWKDFDIQDLLKSSAMLITDYSSVFFDMVYMKKPVLFYQFDLEDFRRGQYKEGYFKYDDNPFGKSFNDVDTTINELERIIKNNFECSYDYTKTHNDIFPFYDTDNSERIYRNIKTISVRE